MKTQLDSIEKPKIIDHNELIAIPIEDNIDGDILVVENPPATPKPMLTQMYMPRQVLL